MGTVTQKFDGDAKGLEKELAKLQKEIIKLREENSKTAKQSVTDTEKQERALKKFADAVKREVETPLESFRRKTEMLEQAHKKGKLTQEEYARATQKLTREMDEANAAVGKAEKSQGNAFASGIKNAVKLAAAWGAVTKAISLANAKLEEQKRLDAEARGEQVTVAGSEAKVKRNLFLQGVSGPERQKFLDEVKKVQQETGFQDVSALNLAAAAGVSASSGDTKATLDALRASVEIVPDEPGALASFAGASLDIGKASGIKDARRNLAFLLSVGTQSRVEESSLQSKTIPQAVFGAAATDTGTDRERALREAGSVFATLTSYATDKTGESGRTASLQLATQLRTFFQDGKKFEGELVKPEDDPGTLFGRIQTLQNNDQLRRAFLKTASFEQTSGLPVEQLFDRDSEVAKQLQSSFGQINFDRSKFGELATDIRGGNEVAVIADTDRKMQGNLQRFTVGDTAGSERDISRGAVNEVADRTTGKFFADYLTRDNLLAMAKMAIVPKSATVSDLAGMRGGFMGIADQQMMKQATASMIDSGMRPEDAAIGVLQRQETAIRRRSSFLLSDYGGPARSDSQLSASELSQVKYIQEQIQALTEMKEGLQRIADGNKEVVTELKQMNSKMNQQWQPSQQTVAVQKDLHR